MRALTAAALSILGGAALGAAARLLPAPTPGRTTAALFTAFGVAVCAAACARFDAARARQRAVKAAALLTWVLLFAWTSAAVAGDATLVAACAVVGGAAIAAAGIASFARSRGVPTGSATWAGAALVAATAGALFVADPFVDWNGGGEGSRARAETVVSASPLAAIAGDAGLDWQRTTWLYDGPAVGTPGLSVIGQYYPSRPASPWVWSLCAAAAGLAALLLAVPGRREAPEGG